MTENKKFDFRVMEELWVLITMTFLKNWVEITLPYISTDDIVDGPFKLHARRVPSESPCVTKANEFCAFCS